MKPTTQQQLFPKTRPAAKGCTRGVILDPDNLGAGGLLGVMDTVDWVLAGGDAYDLLAALPDESLDLLITSPPYWGQRSYGLDHDWKIVEKWREEGDDSIPPYDWYRANGGVLGLEPIPEWFIHHLDEIFVRAHRALKPEGSLWVNLGDTYFARWASIRDEGRQGLGDTSRIRRRAPMGGYRQEKQLLLIPSRFAIAMQNRRWILRNDLIWHKPNVPPRPEKDRLRLTHEHFFHFVKRPSSGRAKYYYNLSMAESDNSDVVTCFVRSGETGHTATFPEELILPRILSSSPPGGIVCDPFCGSGRALVCATNHDRKGVGFDLVPSYVSLAAAQLSKSW